MLSDFGISIHSLEPNVINSQTWAGTLPYMAPEQSRGQAVFASDQYALAVLAYEWLCGVRPFEGSPTSLAYQHANVPPPRLREKDPSLPEAVEVVLLKALSKKPEFSRRLDRCWGASVTTGLSRRSPSKTHLLVLLYTLASERSHL